jgi:hypothetical protein
MASLYRHLQTTVPSTKGSGFVPTVRSAGIAWPGAIPPLGC